MITKQQLSYLVATVSLPIFNLLLAIAAISMAIIISTSLHKLNKDIKYVKEKSFHSFKTAPSQLQDEFEEMIANHDLIINNQNVQYTALEEEKNLLNAKYDLALEGGYSKFLDYLKGLNDKNMLGNINSLALTIIKPDSININIKLECLYEINK